MSNTPRGPVGQDGPSLETYIETRFNLLITLVDKLEVSLRERIEDVERASLQRKEHLKSSIDHTEEMLKAAQDNLKLHNERAEKTQHDINIASNEWRSTLNDFRGSVATKLELDRLYVEFGAYKLENEKRMAASVGERAAKVENKEDWKSLAALVISIGVGILTYLTK